MSLRSSIRRFTNQTDQAFLPFARPDVGDAEIDAVTRVMRSGWLTTGAETQAFERDLVEYLGGDLHAVAVNSATAGLHLALEATRVGPGDEVIAPTLTFTATVEVARYLGADAVLVDVDPVTLNIDPARIEAAIAPRTQAIMPVHYGGLACDMAAILDIAARQGLAGGGGRRARVLPSTHGPGTLVGQLPRHGDGVQFLCQQDHHHWRGRHGGDARQRALVARMKVVRLHGISLRCLRPLHEPRAGQVPRSRGARLQVQPDRHGCGAGARAIGAPAGVSAARRQQLAARYLAELRDLPLRLPVEAPAADTRTSGTCLCCACPMPRD